MQVKGTQTTTVEVEIHERDVIEMINERLMQLIKLPVGNHDSGVYLRDGKIVKWKTYYTSHSWDVENVLRDATELDKAVFMVLKELRNPTN